MIQENKVFIPHVVAIPLGGTVDFPNRDPFFHNVFSNFAGQPFDLPLYAPGTPAEALLSPSLELCGSSVTSIRP